MTEYLWYALYIILSYIFYWRVFMIYYTLWKYKNTGVEFIYPVYPIVGNIPQLAIQTMKHPDEFPLTELVRNYFGDNMPKMVGIFLPNFVVIVEDLDCV